MLKKLIAPAIAGGILVGSLAMGGAAYAATPAPTTAPAAHAAVKPAKPVHHWLRAHRKALRKAGIAISASTIGITPKALVAELKSGKSIAQVATEHNVTSDTVVGSVTKAADAKVAQLVTAHKLTQAQGGKIDAVLSARITKLVNHVF
jgi:hypothetical protein